MIDYFPLPDGRLLHPYEIVSRLVWGPTEWMKQYQLVQERRDRVVLYVVADEPPPAERLQEIERAVRPILGAGVEFEVQLAGSIPVDAQRQAPPVALAGPLRVRSRPVRARSARGPGPPADARRPEPLLPPLRRLAALAAWSGRSDPGLRPVSRAGAAPCRRGRRRVRPHAGGSRLPRPSWPDWGWGRGRSTSSSPGGTVAARGAPSPSGCSASRRS